MTFFSKYGSITVTSLFMAIFSLKHISWIQFFFRRKPLIRTHFREKCALKGLAHVGFIMIAAYFCHSSKLQVEYNRSLIKVEWLAACITLRVVGAVLVVFFRRWRKICTIRQPMGSKGQPLMKSPKPC